MGSNCIPHMEKGYFGMANIQGIFSINEEKSVQAGAGSGI